MGGLWDRERETQSLDSDDPMLHIQEPLAPVFIGPEALLMGEHGLKRLENVSYRVKELESDPLLSGDTFAFSR